LLKEVFEMKDTLKKLTSIPSVSGNEKNIAAAIRKELKGHVTSIEEDAFGNLIAKKGKGSPKIMIAAHMDEIGLMVKYVDEKGFIRFVKVGGVNDQMLISQRVIIHTPKKDYPGVIGSKPVHLLSEEERKQLVKFNAMFIDAGFKTDKEAKKAGVEVGSWVSIHSSPAVYENNRFKAKGLDNKAGCAALIELMKSIKPKCEINAVFTVQEEVGLKGAKIAAYRITPDIGIVLDTTFPGDSPNIKKEETNVELGKGPVITLADGGRECVGSGLIINPKLKDWIVSVAKKNKIPYQLEVIGGGTTDATVIALTKGGIPSISIGIPTRYLHTPCEVLDMKDLQDTVKLMQKALQNLPKI